MFVEGAKTKLSELTGLKEFNAIPAIRVTTTATTLIEIIFALDSLDDFIFVLFNV